MRVYIFVVAATAAALSAMPPTVYGQTTGMMMPPKNCWPSNDTVWGCFSSLPEERLLQRPCPVNDSYPTEKGRGLDFADYSLITVQKAPQRFCDHKDHLVHALECMTSSMTSKCPDMPREMKPGSDRLTQAFHGVCGKMAEMDAKCMQDHWMAARQCKKYVMEEMRKMHMQSSDSGGWESGSGGIKDGATPPPNKESLPEWGALTDPESESEPTWEPEPEWGMDGDREEKVICNFKFRMMGCVRKKMMACHERTAEMMAKFMKEMATAPCAAMMDTWAAQVTGDNCMGPDCSGASKLPVQGMLSILVSVSLGFWMMG